VKQYCKNLNETQMTQRIGAGIAGLFLAAITMVSCGTTAHIEKDESVNFNQYKTYAWLKKSDEKTKDRSNDFVETTIKNAVDEQIQKNTSWRQVTKNPDLILSYDLLIERGVSERSDPVYSNPGVRTYYNPYTRRYVNVYYPSRFMGYDRYDVPVNEGTVSISMIDASTDKTIWQGWTTDQIDSKRFKSKEAQSAIRSIFKKFDLAKN
jgi:hypothetical protein